MVRRPVSARWPLALLAFVMSFGWGISALAGGLLGVFSLPVTGHGDSLVGSAGAPVALTPTTILVGVEGPDGFGGTADDEILLITSLHSSAVITPLPVPFRSHFSGRITRFSATRAGTIAKGPDDSFGTADDRFYLLDRLGTDNVITPITVPGLDDVDAATAVPLTVNSAVIKSRGPDTLRATADDELILVEDLGGANTVTHLSAPFADRTPSWPVALSPTSMVLGSPGPDAVYRTADDALHLFTGLGDTNTRTTLPLPNLARSAGGRPTRVSPTSLLVSSVGADQADGTGDDRLKLITGLGSSNTLTNVFIGHLHRDGAQRPALLSPTTAAVATEGPDSTHLTADDTVAIVTGLGTANTITHITVGALDRDAGCAPQRLSPTSLAVASGGPNQAMNDADDELVVISGIGTTNTVTRIPVAGLHEGVTSQPVALGVDSFLLGSGGPDGQIDSGSDDLLSLVTGVPNVPSVQSVVAAAHLGTYSLSCSPYPVGAGRAVAFSSGDDGVVGAGGDDVIRVMTDLPQPIALLVKSLSLKFNPLDSGAKQSMDARGALILQDPTLIEGVDLTVSLGNIAQRIPAALLVRKKSSLEYSDPANARGFIRKLSLNFKKKTFTVQGKGAATGIEATDPGYIPVAIDAGELYVSDLVAGVANSKGIKFRL